MLKKWIKILLQTRNMSNMSINELKNMRATADGLIKKKNYERTRSLIYSFLTPIEKLKYDRDGNRYEIKVYDIEKVDKFFEDEASYKYPNEIEHKALLKNGVVKFCDVAILLQYLNNKELEEDK